MFRYITQEGWTDTTSWLIIFREDYNTVQAALSANPGQGKDAERYYNIFLAARHEGVHFWHSISTNFLYSYSCNTLQRCVDVLRSACDAKKTYHQIPFEEFQPSFKELTDVLEAGSASGIRTFDVMEGCAILCSYRMNASYPSHTDFLQHLDSQHQGQAEYRSAYLFATQLLGEIAFDLFSPTCYLALQGDNPGRDFEDILRFAKEALNFSSPGTDPLTFLLKAAHLSEDGCLPSVIQQQGIPEGFFHHPILVPFIEKVGNTRNIRLADIFARPYHYEPMNSPGYSRDIANFLSEIVPPIHLYSGDRAKLMGLGQQLGKEYFVLIHHITSIVGLVARLVFDRRPNMICPHQTCPVYDTYLCQKYYAFPRDDYRKCQFPTILEKLKLEKLLDNNNLGA